jgi:hypothetical protein
MKPIYLTLEEWALLSDVLERYSGRPTNAPYNPEEEQPTIQKFSKIVDDMCWEDYVGAA